MSLVSATAATMGSSTRASVNREDLHVMTAEPSESRFLPAAALDFDYTGDLALGRTGLRPGQPRVSVVVPAKNEAANIRAILPYLSNYFEVVVVLSRDDDDSAQAAREALPSAKVVYQTRKGKGNALACGFEDANGMDILPPPAVG